MIVYLITLAEVSARDTMSLSVIDALFLTYAWTNEKLVHVDVLYVVKHNSKRVYHRHDIVVRLMEVCGAWHASCRCVLAFIQFE